MKPAEVPPWMVCPHCFAEVKLKQAPQVFSGRWTTEDHLVAQGHACAEVKRIRGERIRG